MVSFLVTWLIFHSRISPINLAPTPLFCKVNVVSLIAYPTPPSSIWTPVILLPVITGAISAKLPVGLVTIMSESCLNPKPEASIWTSTIEPSMIIGFNNAWVVTVDIPI